MKGAPLAAPASRDGFYFKLAVLALLALALFVFWPGLMGGKMLWGSDIETLELPFSISARRSIAQGEWPFWMPELLGGMPGIAAANLVFLYPSELLIDILKIPVAQGFALDAALQVFLAGLGMLLFCRRLGASLEGSFLAAFAFALSGSEISILLAGHINNIKAIAMIPWCFWAAMRAFQERSFFAWALCGLMLALQILGIGMQIFAYTMIGLAALVGWQAWIARGEAPQGQGLKEKTWLFGILGLVLALFFMSLLAAPQLWPSFQYKPYSWRQDMGYEQFTSWSFNPKESIDWFVPGFYGWHEPSYRGDWPFCLSSEYFGILPWILAFVALAALLKRRKGMVRFLAGLAVLSYLIGLGKWTPIHLLFFHLPIYSGFRTWARFLTLFSFSICALASLGYDQVRDTETAPSSQRTVLMASLGIALLALASVLASGPIATAAAPAMASKLGAAAQSQIQELIQSSALRSLALAFAFGILLWMRPIKSWFLVFLLLLGLQAWDISDLCGRYLVFRDSSSILLDPPAFGEIPDPLSSPEPYRIVELPGSPPVWAMNHGIMLGYESLLGYHGLELSAPNLLKQAMQKRQGDLLNLMGVRYLLSRQALAGFPLLHDGEIKVYLNNQALPRAWLVSHALEAKDDQDAYALLGQASFDPAQDIVLTQDESLPARGKDLGTVQWLDRSPNHFDLEVQTRQNSALMLSQTWYPAWRCEEEGHPLDILKADGALDAVLLSPGDHRLHFYYSARLFNAALGACFLGLLLLGLFAWGHRRGLAWA